MDADADLLRRYAETRSEEAFAALVQRHLGLVYHAALRRCGGDAHRAQDVAQQVFTAVARDAATLAKHPLLAGWLYVATRHLAAKVMREEQARRRREEAAHAMSDIQTPDTSDADWARLRPELDAVLDALGERDRHAVLLRFFEGRPFAEVGAALRLTEDAARRRVDRAVEKMRTLLARRGIHSTAAALSLLLTHQLAAAVPAGLAATVTGAALAGGAVTTVATTATFLGLTKLQLGLVAALVVMGTTQLALQRSTNAALATEIASIQKSDIVAAVVPAEARRQVVVAALSREDDADLARLLEEAAELKALLAKNDALVATSPQAAAMASLGSRLYWPEDLTKQPVPRKQKLPPSGAFGLSGAAHEPAVARHEVVVDFIIDQDGLVKTPVVRSSTNPRLDRATLEAVQEWYFFPGEIEGRPVSTRVQLPIVYVQHDVVLKSPSLRP